MRDAIFGLYTLLLPIYPTRKRVYNRKEYKGEKALYPQALLIDLVELLKERFPDDLKDLTKDNIVSAIQYRLKKK